ncbi:MAG: hypothetical protein AAF481_12345 [Acidobacteriota bacterium]
MPTERMITRTAAPTRIVHRQPIVVQKMHLMVVSPLFSSTEARKLSNKKALVKATDGKKWTTLEGWLNPVPGESDVLCRKTGLQIELKRRVASSVQLLPFQGGTPKAKVFFATDRGTKSVVMQATMDTRRGVVSLVLPFVKPDWDDAARAAGLNLYGEIVAALSGSAGITVQLSYNHSYRVQVRRPVVPPPQGGRVPRPRRRDRPGTPARVVARRPHPQLRANPQIRMIEQPQLTHRIDRRTLETLLRERGRHSAKKPPPTQTEKPGTVQGVISQEVKRPQNHPSAFPDLLRAANNGWGHLTGPSGATLHFRDTDRPDTFHYLPTVFRLGYHADRDGASGRPPMRPEYYLDDDRRRVKVTLVAVPDIADEDRAALATHLRDTVLLGKLPFVRLVPASGLTTEFLPTFATRSVDGQQTLPASIVFRALETDIDDRVLMEFDMGATEYSIFIELMHKGLRGTATVSGDVQESVPVDLSLDAVASVCRVMAEAPGDSAAPGVYVWCHEEDDPPEDRPPRVYLEIANRLEHPVRVESIHAGLLDSGTIAGMIFDAEEVQVSQPLTLAARDHHDGDDHLPIPLAPQRIAVWDETVPQVGKITVQGGTPQQWLDRVHEDPSITQAEFVLPLNRVPVVGDEQLQTLRVRLFEADAGAPREEIELSAAELPKDWFIPLTLKELAGELPDLFLEYDCVTADGEISLPQRQGVNPKSSSTVHLRPAIPGPHSVFDLETGSDREEGLDLETAARRVQELQSAGATWKLFVRTVEPEPVDTDPVDTEPVDTDPQEPTETGTPVQIITDLLAAPFAAGELASVFVTLQPTGEGAQTTLAIEADQPETRTWVPDVQDVPPFHYRVTYLFADDRPPKRVEGTEASPVLVLDPEA